MKENKAAPGLIGLLLAALIGLSLLWPGNVSAQEPDDPLVLGAWLYEGHCVRCHGSYEQERVGAGVSAKELVENIENGGCAVSWGRRAGGPLKSAEIKAIVQYMLAWEEQGGPPDLPELPPQPTATPSPTPLPVEGLLPAPTPPPIDETVQLIISGNPLAWGAWLYTQNCYRCHQAYEDTRQGRGASPEQLEDTLENGKTSTNMKPFGRKKGGTLKSREIEAIILYIHTWETLRTRPALAPNLMTPPTPDPAAFEPIALPEIPAIQGDAARGASLYALYCRKCHGVEGQGQLGPALVKTWPSVRPDLTIRSTMAQGIPDSLMPGWGPALVKTWPSVRPDLTIRSTMAQGIPDSLMPGWGQANGGPLPEQDINDLTALILKWAIPVSPTSPGEVSPMSVWQGPLGLLALVAAPLLLTFVAFMAEPSGRKREK